MSVNAVTKIVGRSFINFGQYLNVLGGKLNPEVDRLQRSRRVNPFLGSQPTVQNPLFLAPSAAVYGNVTIDPGCTVWYNAVIRAEKGPVVIGANSHIQVRRGGGGAFSLKLLRLALRAHVDKLLLFRLLVKIQNKFWISWAVLLMCVQMAGVLSGRNGL